MTLPLFNTLDAAYQLHFYLGFKTHYLRPLFMGGHAVTIIDRLRPSSVGLNRRRARTTGWASKLVLKNGHRLALLNGPTKKLKKRNSWQLE
ncbi:MAG TPA: hypothetical protein VJ124_15025 [Pyrinomonadaceae bacterium]|nr:hypothetical protein [Pyrinomonadaceae bacterium]